MSPLAAPSGSVPPQGSGSSIATASPSAPPPLPGFFEALPVSGHLDAWLSLPTGATSRRPVVVVIHGMDDRPDWQCGGWRRATAEQAFVLCPRGTYDPGQSTKDDWRYTHPAGKALLDHVNAALAALNARYPDYVDADHPLLAGFSLGASEVLAIAVQSPNRFPRIALIEGAAGAWPSARIDAFLQGGVRVLYGAGQRANEATMRATAKQLVARGLETHVVFAPVGHTFDPPLEDAVRAELGWFTEGDDRWSADGGAR